MRSLDLVPVAILVLLEMDLLMVNYPFFHGALKGAVSN
jgi:hypothetical protein